jgi:hypothetical protein
LPTSLFLHVQYARHGAEPDFFVGLDVGQSNEFIALAVLEKSEIEAGGREGSSPHDLRDMGLPVRHAASPVIRGEPTPLCMAD